MKKLVTFVVVVIMSVMMCQTAFAVPTRQKTDDANILHMNMVDVTVENKRFHLPWFTDETVDHPDVVWETVDGTRLHCLDMNLEDIRMNAPGAMPFCLN